MKTKNIKKLATEKKELASRHVEKTSSNREPFKELAERYNKPISEEVWDQYIGVIKILVRASYDLIELDAYEFQIYEDYRIEYIKYSSLPDALILIEKLVGGLPEEIAPFLIHFREVVDLFGKDFDKLPLEISRLVDEFSVLQGICEDLKEIYDDLESKEMEEEWQG